MSIYYVIYAILLVIVGILMWVRNAWVCKNRMMLLDLDIELNYTVASYNTMMLKFWKWDIREFIKEGFEQHG